MSRVRHHQHALDREVPAANSLDRAARSPRAAPRRRGAGGGTVGENACPDGAGTSRNIALRQGLRLTEIGAQTGLHEEECAPHPAQGCRGDLPSNGDSSFPSDRSEGIMSTFPASPDALVPEPWQEPGREGSWPDRGTGNGDGPALASGRASFGRGVLRTETRALSANGSGRRLIAEELALAESGVGVDLVELQRRFPQWRREVTILAHCRRIAGAGAVPQGG